MTAICTRFRIGGISGYSYGEYFDRADWLQKDEGAKDEVILLKRLLSGRFDIGIGHIDRIRYFAHRQGIANKIAYLKPYQPGISQYIAFSKARAGEALAQRFAEALSDFKKTPEYLILLKKYGIEYDPSQ
ncbi:hypothetical protein [Psychromonas ossibalaenae]|uniref:hypothetical protein n=1 Tax=Psychromonas ossibalaenae TaxID=444922 RepID=UPI0003803B3A|nr:hypothetical protein [Psychromonas ossibalaenae]